jgi:dephospho-CoA kinase
MLRIGITGGIGSGKSTVCDIFEYLGIPVFRADVAAKNLYTEHPGLRGQIISYFGPETYNGDQLDRLKLAQLVFADPGKLKHLNSLIHPLVFELYEAWCTQYIQEVYTIKEAAIMFESGSYKHLHYIIGVVADDALRVQRVVARDGISEADVLQRMQNQIDQQTLISRCDFTVENNGKESLITQVLKLDQQIRTLHKANPNPALRVK